jgi:8-oxo-dGTP diphosphatase
VLAPQEMTDENLPAPLHSGLVPWDTWVPVDLATLCFVVSAGKILLILKKRGLGAGKVNGPGGRIEPGETALAAAIRETEEELGVTPIGPELRGELQFQFVDGYSLRCGVFLAKEFRGEAVETEEAVPLWTELGGIPYERMWEDDRHWLPLLLAGEFFVARFHFDGEKLLTKEIFPGRENFFKLQGIDLQ